MSPNMSRLALLGTVCLLTQAGAVNAQGWFPTGNNCCPTCCPPPVTCMQPVSVPCYQTVPVTHYENFEQTVMKPVCRTEYREEPVTACRPVVEERTAEIPTCTYQPVTEFIPQTRNCGTWQTYAQCCPRMSPCQYDPNPGLLGWLNRTGYSIRMSFTPQVVYRQQYVPRYITTMVPMTRQVAQHSVRRVTYNVTRMETYQTTRRVAVNRVDMVPEKIVMQRPITVMTTVPIGTSLAWVPAGSVTGTATAFGPSPDPISARALRRGERAAERVGERLGEEKGFHEGKQFQREKDRDRGIDEPLPGSPNSRTEVVPQRKTDSPTVSQQLSPRIPSVVRVAGWVARNRNVSSDSQVAQSTVSVVDAKH
jgi:hypothetical protein